MNKEDYKLSVGQELVGMMDATIIQMRNTHTSQDQLSELVRTLLEKRGLTTAEDIAHFLNPNYDLHTHDPFLLSDMTVAVDRIFAAMEKGEKIAIYADFDCDGIPGAAVLFETFRKIGYEQVQVYIPHRDKEGYGVHIAAIDTLARSGVSLIITVDVGITACAAVEHARTHDIEMIITDHHELVGELPAALAVVNPKREPYPYPHLCGAAVAFKLAQALLRAGNERSHEACAAIPSGWEKWLLDLVGIATIADMVPLVGENRVLATFGLHVLRKSPRPGIRALVTLMRLKQQGVTEDDIGFSFAPRINAASRMDEPELAFRLLVTQDTSEAEQLAAHLEKLNTSRKGVVGAIVKEARRRVQDRFSQEERVAVLGDIDWKPALLGLAANSVLADRSGVVCLWGRDAQGKLKGSCRSDGSISVVDLFQRTGDALEQYGGHTASGGFSVSHEKIHTLHDAFARALSEIETESTEPSENDSAVTIDTHLPLARVSHVLLKDIAQLAPFGVGNAKPVFRIPGVRVAYVKRFGKENNHTEVTLVHPDTSMRVRAFQFFVTPEDFSVVPKPEHEYDIIATLEKDTFRGEYAVCLRIVDIVHPLG